MPQPSGDYTALKTRCDQISHSPHRPRPTEDPSRFQSESRKTEAPEALDRADGIKKAFPDFFFYEPAQPSYRVRKLSAHAPASIFFPPASFPPISPAGASGDGDYTLPPALFALFPCHVPSPPPSPLRQPLIKKVHALPSPSKAQDLNNRCRRRLEGDDAINHSKESVTLPLLPPSLLTYFKAEGKEGRVRKGTMGHKMFAFLPLTFLKSKQAGRIGFETFLFLRGGGGKAGREERVDKPYKKRKLF